MGWFDEQIKERKQNDNDIFADSFVNIAGAVMGKRMSDALNDDITVAKKRHRRNFKILSRKNTRDSRQRKGYE